MLHALQEPGGVPDSHDPQVRIGGMDTLDNVVDRDVGGGAGQNLGFVQVHCLEDKLYHGGGLACAGGPVDKGNISRGEALLDGGVLGGIQALVVIVELFVSHHVIIQAWGSLSEKDLDQMLVFEVLIALQRINSLFASFVSDLVGK